METDDSIAAAGGTVRHGAVVAAHSWHPVAPDIVDPFACSLLLSAADCAMCVA